MLEGLYTALVTPFDGRGEIDYDALDSLIRFQKTNGADGIVLLGTTGESPTVSEEEAERMTVFAKSRMNGMALICGCSSNDTKEAKRKALKAEKLGADALLVLTPYYNKTNDEGMLRHFTEVADSVSIPVILYHVPGRTGCKISLPVLETLAKHPNIIGIKEASGDMNYFSHIAPLASSGFALCCGCDELALPMLSMGAEGVISVLSNIYPREVKDMITLFKAGKTEEARALQLRFLPLIDALFSETNPIPVKTAMNRLGFGVGGFRLPLAPMSKEKADRLAAVLDSFPRPNFD